MHNCFYLHICVSLFIIYFFHSWLYSLSRAHINWQSKKPLPPCFVPEVFFCSFLHTHSIQCSFFSFLPLLLLKPAWLDPFHPTIKLLLTALLHSLVVNDANTLESGMKMDEVGLLINGILGYFKTHQWRKYIYILNIENIYFSP